MASWHGRIYSYTVAHYAYHPSFAGEPPYTLVTVDLAEGPRALRRWLGDAAPAFGTAVQRVILHRESSPKLAFTAV